MSSTRKSITSAESLLATPGRGHEGVRILRTLVASLEAASIAGYADASGERTADLCHCYGRLASIYARGENVKRSPQEALRLLGLAAKLGDRKAGFLIANSNSPNITAEERVALWNAHAEDDAHAAYLLGLRYAHGRGVEQDRERARYFLAKANSNDHPFATLELGQLCEAEAVEAPESPAVPVLLRKAFDYFRAAAQLGNGLAWLAIGNFYQAGFDRFAAPSSEAFSSESASSSETASSSSEASSSSSSSSSSETSSSSFTAASSSSTKSSKLSKSERKKLRRAKAYEAFKIAADRYGVAEAMHNVGVFHADGKLDGDSDQQAAARYYKQAADKGYGPSQLMLANRLMVPRDSDDLPEHLAMCGVDYSLERALHYAALAARQHTRGAELLLAKILFNKGEFQLGLQNLLASAQEQPALVEAQVLLARVYQSGLGPLPPNPAQAEVWLERAVANGDDPEAKYSLVGLIKERDPERASRLLKEAADDDHPEACCDYGSYLRRLLPTAVDPSTSRLSEGPSADDEEEEASPAATAFFYLTKAALHQLPRALVELALMYHVGSSPPDKDVAYATELLQFAKQSLDEKEFTSLTAQIWTDVPLPPLTPTASSSSSSTTSSSSSSSSSTQEE